MKVCNNCNTVNSDESRFCVSCGAEIVGSAGMANEFSNNNQGFNNQNTMNQGQQFNQSTNQGQQFNAPDGSMYQGGSKESNTSINPQFLTWAPIITAVLGVIIGWFLSVSFGFVLSVAGLAFAIVNKNRYESFPIIQVVAGVIAILVSFVFFGMVS